MWVGTVKTNDPLVASNPERYTFYGFHRNPGYDDWFGFFYGDFRGRPGDASGWVKLLHEDYPNHYQWNFADNTWAVHGHAKTSPSTSPWTLALRVDRLVLVGPTKYPRRAGFGLARLLASPGYEDVTVDIEQSTVPFRT